MKITSSFVALSMLLAATGASYAQSMGSDNHAAYGAIDPNEPHDLPNGERSPAPKNRANGGVGAMEVPYDNAQTRSGGPVGGNTTQNGG